MDAKLNSKTHFIRRFSFEEPFPRKKVIEFRGLKTTKGITFLLHFLWVQTERQIPRFLIPIVTGLL